MAAARALGIVDKTLHQDGQRLMKIQATAAQTTGQITAMKLKINRTLIERDARL